MFWLEGFLEVFVPWIILYKYNRSNSFVIVFTCSIAFQWYQRWYGNNYLNLIDCQASQKKDGVQVSLHRATSRDVSLTIHSARLLTSSGQIEVTKWAILGVIQTAIHYINILIVTHNINSFCNYSQYSSFCNIDLSTTRHRATNHRAWNSRQGRITRLTASTNHRA